MNPRTFERILIAGVVAALIGLAVWGAMWRAEAHRLYDRITTMQEEER